jgi:hypothetical protein
LIFKFLDSNLEDKIIVFSLVLTLIVYVSILLFYGE